MARRRVAVRRVSRNYIRRLSGILLTASCFVSFGLHAQSLDEYRPVLTEARDWLGRGQGHTAYRLLSPLEPKLAGSAEYDYLIGQAALAIDEPSLAAFAFERCLAVDPRSGLCRLGMARAHIALAEQSSARTELDLVTQSAPPPEVQQAVAKYMSQLSGQETTSSDSRLTSYMQLGIGYDSNINNATALDRMALPRFYDAVFALTRDGQRRGSGFGQARFNISYSTPLAPRWRFLTEANLAATGNWATQRYNSVVSDGSVGLMYRHDKHQVTGKVIAQNYQLGGHSYRNLVGALGQYVYSLSERSQLSIFAQGSRLTYPGAHMRNANRYTGGASWSQALAKGRAVAYLSAYGGAEKAVHSAAPDDYGFNFGGARLGGMYLITPRTQVEAGVGIERRRYQGEDFLFMRKRRETFYDGYIGLVYAINRKLSLRPQYRYSHSDSTIPLRDYQRHVFSVNLRYELF